MTDFRVDDARVACPLFQEEYGGSIPTSALQLKIAKIPSQTGLVLNQKWHSRLPEMGNGMQAEWFGAEFANIFYAVACWSAPVARMLNGRGMYELRRMAVADDAPKNTATRMLRIMRILISKERPEVRTLISYQDTEVHAGTIYRAAGWQEKGVRAKHNGWSCPSRERPNHKNANAEKIRWELEIKPPNEPNPLFVEPSPQPREQELL